MAEPIQQDNLYMDKRYAVNGAAVPDESDLTGWMRPTIKGSVWGTSYRGEEVEDELGWEKPTTEQVRAAVEALEPRKRRIIRAIYWQSKSSRDIARMLHLPQRTVVYLHHKALDELRAALEAP